MSPSEMLENQNPSLMAVITLRWLLILCFAIIGILGTWIHKKIWRKK